MNRSVAALSPVTSGVSLAVLTEGDDIPKIGFVVAPTPAAPTDRDIASARQRIDETAAAAVEKILSRRPTLAVLPMLLVGDTKTDTSGPRRAGLWWRIAALLEAGGVPVAAYPPLALQRWMGRAKTDFGHEARRWVGAEVQRTWPGARRDMSEAFRWDTVGYASVGAAVIGMPTALEISAARVKLLRSGDWPAGLEVPMNLLDHRALQERTAAA